MSSGQVSPFIFLPLDETVNKCHASVFVTENLRSESGSEHVCPQSLASSSGRIPSGYGPRRDQHSGFDAIRDQHARLICHQIPIVMSVINDVDPGSCEVVTTESVELAKQ